jgi:hypothetical protein
VAGLRAVERDAAVRVVPREAVDRAEELREAVARVVVLREAAGLRAVALARAVRAFVVVVVRRALVVLGRVLVAAAVVACTDLPPYS